MTCPAGTTQLFDNGPLDATPVLRALKRNPARLLNPLDLLLEAVRPHYFRAAQFDGPPGDPGWFGPGSATWYVHAHAPSVVLGMFNAALVDILHQDIQYAVFDHSLLVGRDVTGTVIPGTLSTANLFRRLGRSFSFFLGVTLGSSEGAESLTKTIRALHGAVHGHRPDGRAYDADDEELLRWTYATVIEGFAAAHSRYHPRPLVGADLDRLFDEYATVGEALGGADLPRSREECRIVIETSPAAREVALNPENAKYLDLAVPWYFKPGFRVALWALFDMAPEPIRVACDFVDPLPLRRALYRRLVKLAVFIASPRGRVRETISAQRRTSRRRAPTG